MSAGREGRAAPGQAELEGRGGGGGLRRRCRRLSAHPLLCVCRVPPPRAPQLRARDPASRGDRYMLVTFEEPPYAIKVTPVHHPPKPDLPLLHLHPPARARPSFWPLRAAAGGRPPPASPGLPAVRGSSAHTGSGGGGSADINMADIFFFSSPPAPPPAVWCVCEQQ